jgi:uncharacterized glyoxalase superfamily metalloenzyme YdcJ
MACAISNEATIPELRLQSLQSLANTDHVRTIFAHAMSTMYRREVPLYGDLVNIVQRTNSDGQSEILNNDSLQRLSLERHGAIRLGTAQELRTIKRLFQVLGMHAVGYYDLSVAGLPMHGTCFRPIDRKSLEANPFRVFTTLLRPDLLQSDHSKSTADSLLQQRKIFTPLLLQLLDQAEQQDYRLTVDQVEVFIPEALSTFSWQHIAAATRAQYATLCKEHPILADIACFRSAHINHLTPRVLDIDVANKAMKAAGMPVKASIEGPPKREWPILLRQTSFLALEEEIQFISGDEDPGECNFTPGSHKARFGEIEERGAALTPKGRRLFDALLAEANDRFSQLSTSSATRDSVLSEVFRGFPDDWSEMRKEGLVYCVYKRTDKPLPRDAGTIVHSATSSELADMLVTQGLVEAQPITYEDFLPFSAAGIFQSNLQITGTTNRSMKVRVASDQLGFEDSMGSPLISADDLYSQIERDSLRECLEGLGIEYRV